ncbi:hypothetical protein HF313_22855 [Massilia atriviolacea]|uniref:Uncharacterized protein n=1 Tax=Massilia atriviolacea TaxID=2495579 RepID=A0A430HCL6_9BURK|nr:hypothetical protein [Massilia atriviolacea]RSZ55239.1 hypothetical protein EJB06_30400 [Massilia atriviolacea]
MLVEKKFKITALTNELAYYRWIQFSKTSKSLLGEQHLSFEETVDMDLAAIEEELYAEVPAERKRERVGCQPLPTEPCNQEQRRARYFQPPRCSTIRSAVTDLMTGFRQQSLSKCILNSSQVSSKLVAIQCTVRLTV